VSPSGGRGSIPEQPAHAVRGSLIYKGKIMVFYIRKWVTPTKLKLYGWKIKSELSYLNDRELTDAIEVLSIVTGMVKDEVDKRRVTIPR
jgi:hypothetical protein